MGAVASDVDASKGYVIGDTVQVVPGDERIRVVGLASDAQFNVSPPSTTYATWERLSRSVNPDAPAVLPTLVAVIRRPARIQAAVAAIDGSVEGVEAVATQTAVDNLPGVESISQSFAVILLLAFIVVVLVTWVFFLILTVQKTQSLTLLRAVGASSRTCSRTSPCRSRSSRSRASPSRRSCWCSPPKAGAVASRSRRAPA